VPEAPASDADLAALVRAIEAGEDGITLPPDLLEEPAPPAPPPPQSLYAQIIGMTVPEKVKLALRGNRDARMILVRDSNQLVRRFVLLNPRISDTEVVAITHNKSADDELLRVIAERREWMQNYQVRIGLATNPKTPLALALKQVPTLAERDLRMIGKSKNVPHAVAAQARRLLMASGASR
jgi:hypothetical protein